MKTGIELIDEERHEQIEKHDWSLEHDRLHNHGQLAKVAASLAVIGTDAVVMEDDEPYEDVWGLVDKLKNDKIHCLKVAGALIAAEIDRLQNS